MLWHAKAGIVLYARSIPHIVNKKSLNRQQATTLRLDIKNKTKQKGIKSVTHNCALWLKRENKMHNLWTMRHNTFFKLWNN